MVAVTNNDTRLSKYSYFGEVFDQLVRTMNFTQVKNDKILTTTPFTDLLINMSRYELVPNDGVYGNNDSGVWTGVVGMANRNVIDIGIAQFTPTRFRKDAVDFAYPLMHAT